MNTTAEEACQKTGVFWHGKEAFRKGPMTENTSFLTWFIQDVFKNEKLEVFR